MFPVWGRAEKLAARGRPLGAACQILPWVIMLLLRIARLNVFSDAVIFSGYALYYLISEMVVLILFHLECVVSY